MTTAAPAPILAPGSAAARRAFWGVMISFLIHGLVVSTWVSRIASVKGALGLGDGALGLALLGAAIGSVAAIPACGWLVTRFSSRRVARWSAAGFALALIPLAAARGVATLTAALVFYGIMAGSNDVAMNSQAVATEKALGTAAISRFHAMFSFGGICGASLGSLLAARRVPASVHLPAASVLLLVPALAMSQWMMEAPAAPRAGFLRPSLRRIPWALAALSAIGFCIFLSEGAIADWAAVFMKQVLHSGDGAAPLAYAVFSASMAVFRFAGDAITVRLGRASTIRAGAALAASGLALVVATHSVPLALAGFAMAGAGFSSIIPLVFAAGGRIPGLGEGAGVATVSGLGYLGFLVGPPTIGFVSEATSLRVGLTFLVLLSTTASLLVGLVDRSGASGPGPLSDSHWTPAPEPVQALP